MAKKETKRQTTAGPKPRVHSDLRGFEVSIDQFGELKSNMNIEAINNFLDKNVDDKKLRVRHEKAASKKLKRKK
jgi:hypothetical protein